MVILLSDIRTPTNHARSGAPPRRVSELADAIKVTGWIAPVQVTPHPVGGYELIAGHRRVAAARQLGLDGIPAEIVDRDSGDLINVAENRRLGTHPLDLAASLERLSGRYAQRDLAALYGISVAQVSRLLRVARHLEPEVRDHYRARDDASMRVLVSLSYQTRAQQLRAITASAAPQRSTGRVRTRPAKSIRVAMRELAKLPTTPHTRAAICALRWAICERAEVLP